MNKKTVLDAGTTWSKIIEYNTDELKQIFSDYLRYSKENKNYYILPSAVLKTCDLKFDAMTGHMSEKFVDNKDSYVNEIIALSSGVKNIEENSIILDLGSRDAKWVRFVDGKFKDLDWNTACASSTGATIEMLMKLAPCQIIGVTGSDGKTTTTSLIYSILKKQGYNTYLGGNIGKPLFTKLEEIKPEDKLVLELSSFQLMGMTVSPNISVITNITPNHLNIHKDYNEYIEAKKTIFKYQKENDYLVLNYDNEITRNCGKEAISRVIYFSSREKLDNGFIVDNKIIKRCNDGIRKHILDTKDVLLRGNHNFENICTALAATENLVDEEIAVEAVKEFRAVEHRLEFIREIDGVKWYNDSVSSSPTRTIAGLNSFDEDIVLIAGGYDKNLDYTPLAKPILEKVKTLILIGATSSKIFDAVKEEEEKEGKDISIYMCENLQETVNLAKRYSKKGEVVLFSPASASFDMFKNFAERGNKFKDLVNNL